MSTDLVPVQQAVPALSTLSLEPQTLRQLENLYQYMTVPPKGLNADSWKFRPEVVKIKTPTTTDELLPGDAEIGDLWAAGEVLWSRAEDGKKEPWMFVPVFHWVSHSKFRQGSRRPDCASPDGITALDGTKCADCRHLPWRDGKKTLCQRTQNFLVLPLDLSGIFVLNFRGTSERAGNSILKSTRGALWGKAYGLSTTERSSDTNTWQQYNVKAYASVPIPDGVSAFAEYVFETQSALHEKLSAERAQKRETIAEVLNDESTEGDALEAELADDGMDFSDSM